MALTEQDALEYLSSRRQNRAPKPTQEPTQTQDPQEEQPGNLLEDAWLSYLGKGDKPAEQTKTPITEPDVNVKPGTKAIPSSVHPTGIGKFYDKVPEIIKKAPYPLNQLADNAYAHSRFWGARAEAAQELAMSPFKLAGVTDTVIDYTTDKIPFISDQQKRDTAKQIKSSLPFPLNQGDASEAVVNWVRDQSPINAWQQHNARNRAQKSIQAEAEGASNLLWNEVKEQALDLTGFVIDIGVGSKLLSKLGVLAPPTKRVGLSSMALRGGRAGDIAGSLYLKEIMKNAVKIGAMTSMRSPGTKEQRIQEGLIATMYAGTPALVGGLGIAANKLTGNPQVIAGVRAKIADLLLNSLLSKSLGAYSQAAERAKGDPEKFVAYAAPVLLSDAIFSMMTTGMPKAELKNRLKSGFRGLTPEQRKSYKIKTFEDYKKHMQDRGLDIRQKQTKIKNLIKKFQKAAAEGPEALAALVAAEPLDRTATLTMINGLTKNKQEIPIGRGLDPETREKYEPQAKAILDGAGIDYSDMDARIMQEVTRVVADSMEGRIIRGDQAAKAFEDAPEGARILQRSLGPNEQLLIMPDGSTMLRVLDQDTGKWSPPMKYEIPPEDIGKYWLPAEEFYKGADKYEKAVTDVKNFFREMGRNVLLIKGDVWGDPKDTEVIFKGERYTLKQFAHHLITEEGMLHPDRLQYLDYRETGQKERASEISYNIKREMESMLTGKEVPYDAKAYKEQHLKYIKLKSDIKNAGAGHKGVLDVKGGIPYEYVGYENTPSGQAQKWIIDGTKYTRDGIRDKFGENALDMLSKETNDIVNSAQLNIIPPNMKYKLNMVPQSSGKGDYYHLWNKERQAAELKSRKEALGLTDPEAEPGDEIPRVAVDKIEKVEAPQAIPYKNVLARIAYNSFDFFGMADRIKPLLDKYAKSPFTAQQFKDGEVPASLKDEIGPKLYEVKTSQSFAEVFGTRSATELAYTVWNSIESNPKARALLDTLKPGSVERRTLKQSLTETYLEAMALGLNEIAVNDNAAPGMYSITDFGLKLPHKSQAARDAYVRTMTDMLMRIDSRKPTKQELRSWSQGRQRLAFFNMLPPELQAYSVWIHKNIFNPMRNAGILAGIYDQANIDRARMEGFAPRVWNIKQSEKEGAGSYRSRIANSTKPSRKYETFPEFLEATPGSNLETIKTADIMVGSYVREVLGKLAMQKYINVMKAISTPEGERMIETERDIMDRMKTAFEEDGISRKDWMLNKLRTYGVDKKVIADFSKTGMTVEGFLSALGYQKTHDMPGFATFAGRQFRVPWLHKSVAGSIRNLMASGEPGSFQKLRTANRIAKNMIMFSPYMFAVNIGSSSAIWLNPKKAYQHWVKPLLPWNIAKNVWVGKDSVLNKIKEDRFDQYESFKEREYDVKLMMDLMDEGMQGFNFADAQSDLYDNARMGTMFIKESSLDKFWEIAKTKFGLDIEVFNNYLGNLQYQLAAKIHSKLMSEGYTYDNAVKMAASFTSDVTGMIPAALYGKEKNFLQGLLFARNFTYSIGRQITGALGLHKQFTGNLSSMFNSLFHGEKTRGEFQALQKYYVEHLMRVVFAHVTAVNLLQLGVQAAYKAATGQLQSEDEDYFAFNNEPGKKLSIKLPWKHDNRPLYLGLNFWREALQLSNMTKNPPVGFLRWAAGKTSTWLDGLIKVLDNNDYNDENIYNVTGSNPIDITKDAGRYYLSRPLPSVAGKQWDDMTFGQRAGIAAGTAVGLELKRGRQDEGAYTQKQLQDWQRILDVDRVNEESIRKRMDKIPPKQRQKELGDMLANGEITPQQYTNEIIRNQFPTQMKVRRNARKLIEKGAF